MKKTRQTDERIADALRQAQSGTPLADVRSLEEVSAVRGGPRVARRVGREPDSE